MKPIPALFLLLAACGEVASSLPDAPVAPDDGAPADDGAVVTDAPGARCDPSKAFGTPTLVPNINSALDEQGFTTSHDELAGFLTRVDQTGPTSSILASGRRGVADAFSVPNDNVTAPINKATGNESSPSPVADGLTLYFHRQVGSILAMLVATRTVGEDFSSVAAIKVDDKQLFGGMQATISADGMTLYWLDSTTLALQAASRGASATSFLNQRTASSMPLGGSAVLTPDERTLYYGNGSNILVSTRANTVVPFAAGVAVPNVNSAVLDYPTHLSHDGCVLYLVSTRAGGLGGTDIWEARRPL